MFYNTLPDYEFGREKKLRNYFPIWLLESKYKEVIFSNYVKLLKLVMFIKWSIP